ncbi:MAG: TonB-dependent receptor [Proteobacteria bacterium]|nr:TonB-dependent receptor [Pseudomonadota bacterium]
MNMSVSGGPGRGQRTLAVLSSTKASTASIAAAVAGILWGIGAPVYAQEAAESAPAANDALSEVVVTANALQGVRKLDASYNIVSLGLDEIKAANPQSAAEIFKLSPGVWPEASGGQTGVNIDIAGFPNGGGDSPYFTTMIQGSPLYGHAALGFLDSSSLVRLDDTVERVEIVQGGTSAIFGPGQAGATANFILRTGSDQSTGSVAGTYGSEGLGRIDAFYSGKIVEGWYGSIGGFYRSSDGVRDPQYTSDVGGQLTATLKHTMDNGSIMFWYRVLNDKNQWVADFPYTVNGGSVAPYPGFNQLNSTYNSKQLQNFLVPNPGGGFRNDDISSGRGAQLNYVGSELKLKFDSGVSISNNFLFDGGYVNTHALVNNGNPQTLGNFISGLQLPGVLSAGAIIPTFTNGAPVSLDQSVVTQQVWYIEKKLVNVTDEFRVSMEIGAGNTLTGGIYGAYYTDNDAWSLGSNVLITNQPNASPIVLQGVGTDGGLYNVTSHQGLIANNGNNIFQQGRAENVAFYLSDSWKLDQWLFDASARVEHISLWDTSSNLTNRQLGSQFDLWDNAVALPNGTVTERDEHNTIPTFSVGANYEFTDHMSAYVRVNNGVNFASFDDLQCNVVNGTNGCGRSQPLTHIRNYEAGFKVQNEFTYIDASIYDKEFRGLGYQPVDRQNLPIGKNTTYGSTAKGIRFIGSVNPFALAENQAVKSFKITVNGNWEDAHYRDFIGCYLYQDINNVKQCQDVNGKQLARLPKFQVRVTPEDTQVFGWGSITEYLTYEHIGQHFQDFTGLNPLGSYYDLSAGIVANYGENWEARLSGSNLTNQIGLTEGNARVGGNAVVNNVGFGRSIVGREVNIQIKYKW